MGSAPARQRRRAGLRLYQCLPTPRASARGERAQRCVRARARECSQESSLAHDPPTPLVSLVPVVPTIALPPCIPTHLAEVLAILVGRCLHPAAKVVAGIERLGGRRQECRLPAVTLHGLVAVRRRRRACMGRRCGGGRCGGRRRRRRPTPIRAHAEQVKERREVAAHLAQRGRGESDVSQLWCAKEVGTLAIESCSRWGRRSPQPLGLSTRTGGPSGLGRAGAHVLHCAFPQRLQEARPLLSSPRALGCFELEAEGTVALPGRR